MDIPSQFAANAIHRPGSLRRTHGTLDLQDIFASRPSALESRSVSLSGSEASDSVSSQILYMKGHNSASRRTPSLTSNASRHSVDSHWDMATGLNVPEEIADQEVFQWPCACPTDRPSERSTEFQYPYCKSLGKQLPRELSPPPCTRDAISGGRKLTHDRGWRGSADDLDNNLAKRAAVQILDSCFTLPPAQIAGAHPFSYSMLHGNRGAVPDSPMISSLRMHSLFRCSPCFGHQARNATRLSMLGGVFDGSSAMPSTPNLFLNSRSSRTGISEPLERHRKYESLEAYQEADVAMATSHSEDANLLAEIPKSDPKLPRRIQPEYHPVNNQPLKKPPAKGRTAFGRALVGSFHDQEGSEDDIPSVRTGYSSTGKSDDGRERRRRARGESEIDDSSDSVVYLNSPASGVITPPAIDPEICHFMELSAQIQLADTPFAAAELIAVHTRLSSDLRSGSRPSDEHPGSMVTNESTKVVTLPNDPLGDAVVKNVPQKTEIQALNQGKNNSPSAARPFSTKRSHPRGRRRRSMLSEAFTPADCN